jgi:peptidyl-prolyl cis-trans isomerase B (cyclophilin B)
MEDTIIDPFFPNDDFLIEPVCGEIQPFSSKDCIIIFTPYQPMLYETEAYCDITGQENRLTLSIVGNGIKPKFTFGFDENFIPLSLSGGHTNQPEKVTDEVTLQISIGKEPAGEIKIALFGNVVPKTVRNFKAICVDGIKAKTYVGSGFHRIIKDFMIQGGDIINGDGTGSASIYGAYFDDENFHIKHTGPGFVSMANSGPNTNGCQFFITTDATPWLDGHHVVFGKVIDGLSIIRSIEKLPVTGNNRPVSDVIITDCTVESLSLPYELRLDKKDRI